MRVTILDWVHRQFSCTIRHLVGAGWTFRIVVGFRRLLRSRFGVYPGCYKQGAPTELYLAEGLGYRKGPMLVH